MSSCKIITVFRKLIINQNNFNTFYAPEEDIPYLGGSEQQLSEYLAFGTHQKLNPSSS